MRVCSIDGCDRTSDARGWCRMHWKRWRRHGDPTVVLNPVGVPALDRWIGKIEIGHPCGCWWWIGSRDAKGYGMLRLGRRTVATSHIRRAHIAGYELLVGPVPPGLELDHLCRNPSCVNPDHLEPVTPAENRRRQYRARYSGEGKL